MKEVAASIIVPSRGGASRLPRLLNALRLQDTTNFEVIVVLDGDIDDSARAVEQFAKKNEIDLKVITFSENRGRSAALNAGFDAAVGEILIRCDDDLAPGVGYVSGHIAAHRDAERGIIGLCQNVFPDSVYARAYGRDADVKFRHDALKSQPDAQWRYWAGNVSIRRKTAERIGKYDERYRRYGWEDVDYGYRLHQAGIPIKIVPALTTAHHGAADSTVMRSTRALHAGAARDNFIEIHGKSSLPQNTTPKSLWQIAVHVTSQFTTERTLQFWGPLIDRIASRVPAAISIKLIALAVEAAGLAGTRFPQRAHSSF